MENYNQPVSSIMNYTRVLWVEDDVNQRQTIVEIIEILGHKGDVAKNGQEALEFLGANKYDILITDIGMPIMSGWKLMEIVNEKYPDEMKITIISGWAEMITTEKQRRKKIDRIICKPYDILIIRDLLNNSISFNKNY
ncbi:MAG: response regulator [Crocinitomicaceae bacterium]|nr:response regulator [Crocinitomicaceae bacterium]